MKIKIKYIFISFRFRKLRDNKKFLEIRFIQTNEKPIKLKEFMIIGKRLMNRNNLFKTCIIKDKRLNK